MRPASDSMFPALILLLLAALTASVINGIAVVCIGIASTIFMFSR